MRCLVRRTAGMSSAADNSCRCPEEAGVVIRLIAAGDEDGVTRLVAVGDADGLAGGDVAGPTVASVDGDEMLVGEAVG